MRSERLVRWVFFGLTLAFIVFIMYASWTPGRGGVGGRKEFQRAPGVAQVFSVHDLRDIATNVLLYVPLGFFLALAVSARRPRFLSPWLLAGPLVSLVMELGQSFIGRTPDVVDIITNSTGFLIGYWIVMAGASFYGLSPTVLLGVNPGDEQDAKTQTIAAIRFIYVSIYTLVALLPFDVSVSLERIYDQLLPNDAGKIRIILDPAYHLSHWDETGLKLTIELLGLLPVGALSALLSALRGRVSVYSSIISCLTLAVFCELCQVFILSRTTDIALIPIAVAAGVMGWAFVRVWFNLQQTDATGSSTETESRWQPLAVALVGYALVIAFFAWSPFRFETDPVTVAKKILHESNIIPFKEHFSTRSLSSAIDIIKETGLFVPFGVLFAYLLFELFPTLPRSRLVLWACAACMAFATLTELSQSVCIGRYIDVTDIFLAGFGGVCGATMLQLFRSDKQRYRRRHFRA